jgi:diguanylate cyclase (GGDEF)-like protein
MAETAIEVRPVVRIPLRRLLNSAIWATLGLHAVLILTLGSRSIAFSRLCTAAIACLAALCFFWRAQRLPVRERLCWRWLSLTGLLWAGGQVVETLIGHSSAASNLSVDASDFLYVTAAFPLLLAISNTRETESVRAVSYLDSAQIGLAFVLTWARLFHMRMPPELAATVMGRIYAAECSLLAVFAIFRLVSWSTMEERRRIRALCAIVWTYLPIELGMDYATRRWNLHAGTLLDLLWSVPFAMAGWQALKMPMDEPVEGRRKFTQRRLLLESICPTLVTAGIFALAASIASQHPVLALSAIFLLLLIQSLHAGVMQMNYVAGQELLLERETELREANVNLERLSSLDPLTGIPNRRRFTAALKDAWRRSMRSKMPIAVLMIDIDFFKGINDLHGHAYGDECLTTIARALGQQTHRADDLLARYGGEEFVVLLSETGEQGAMAVAERMHSVVGELGVVNDASPYGRRLTVSIGVGVSNPRLGVDPAALLEVADRALYEAKHLGRNRICAGTLS